MDRKQISGIFSPETQKFEIIFLVGILILSSSLMVYSLDHKSPWTDEFNSINIAGQTPESIIHLTLTSDPHPPLQYLALHYLFTVAGNPGVPVSRGLFVLFGILSVLCFYPMVRYLVDRNTAFLSTLLFSISPFLIMYSRMARYYPLVLLLSIISYYFFFRIVSRKSTHTTIDHLLLIISLTLLLYTYIPSVVVIVTQMCYLVYIRWKDRSAGQQFSIFGIISEWKYLVTAWVVAGLLFLPWLIGMYISQPVINAGSVGVLGGAVQFPLRFIVPFYVYSIGSTMYPWTWYGVLGLLTFFSLFLFAMYNFYREREFGLLILFLVPLFLTDCILQVFNVSFLDIPQRAMFLLPFFIGIIGYAIIRIKFRWLKLAVILIIILISAISISNYYNDREFIDPMYVVPAKEIVSDLQKNLTPSDIIIAQPTTAIGYYWAMGDIQSSKTPFYTILRDTPEILETINASGVRGENRTPARYILFIENTDTHDEFSKEWAVVIDDLVLHGYTLETQTSYVPTDPLYKKFKEAVLKRPTFAYRLEEKVFTKL